MTTDEDIFVVGDWVEIPLSGLAGLYPAPRGVISKDLGPYGNGCRQYEVTLLGGEAHVYSSRSLQKWNWLDTKLQEFITELQTALSESISRCQDELVCEDLHRRFDRYLVNLSPETAAKIREKWGE